MNKLQVAIIDCAILTPAIDCFNQMQATLSHHLSYHHPPKNGISPLVKTNPQAYIILGSHSNVDDNFAWQRELADFIISKLDQKIPVLGICFGHQLICHKLGLPLGKIKQSTPHSGVREIIINNSQQEKWRKETYQIVVSHAQEVKELSHDFIHLATSLACHIEAVAHKSLPFVGIQGHPEASKTFLKNELNLDNPGPEYLQAQKQGLQFIQTFLDLYLPTYLPT